LTWGLQGDERIMLFAGIAAAQEMGAPHNERAGNSQLLAFLSPNCDV
jgi:hypothetical protein